MAAPAESTRVNPFPETKKICKFHPNCRKGETCAFAHGQSELRISAMAETPAGQSELRISAMAETPTESNQVHNYKTKICSFYPRCRNGDSCKYAHGEKDLRAEGPKPLSVIKYKSRGCKFRKKCRYKARCFFEHKNDKNGVCRMWTKTKTCLFGEGGGCPFRHHVNQ